MPNTIPIMSSMEEGSPITISGVRNSARRGKIMPATTMPTALLFRKVARSLIFSVSAVLPKIAPYRLEILRILADRNCFFQYSEFDNANAWAAYRACSPP